MHSYLKPHKTNLVKILFVFIYLFITYGATAQDKVFLPHSKKGVTLTNKITYHKDLTINQKKSTIYFDKEVIYVKGSKVIIRRNFSSNIYKDAYTLLDYKALKRYQCRILKNGKKQVTVQPISLVTKEIKPLVNTSEKKLIAGQQCYQYQMKTSKGGILTNYIFVDGDDVLSRNVNLPGIALQYESFHKKFGKFTSITTSIEKGKLSNAMFSLKGYEFTNSQPEPRTQQKTEKTTTVKGGIVRMLIKPSETDPKITNFNLNHLVLCKHSKQQKKLLLFLSGTNGIPERGPIDFLRTGVEQGYNVINLAYINKQAVAGICRGSNLEKDSNCTEKFRERRIFGTNTFALIPDEPVDAIVHRLKKLLVYLIENDPKGGWNNYLENGEIKWKNIAVSGQSQGGGMACFIAKKHLVDRVISFSGGWDFSGKNKIANWYYNKSITPPERWHGMFNVAEPMAKVIRKTYEAMSIPEKHIYPLSLKVPHGRKAHVQGG